MTKIIALDVGKARVGVATCDLELRIPHSHDIWPRARGKAEQLILKLIEDTQSTHLVVGLPLAENGEKTEQCFDIERFVNRIVKRANIQVKFVDESHTSIEAQEIMRSRGSKNKHDDAIAACLILERYFERYS